MFWGDFLHETCEQPASRIQAHFCGRFVKTCTTLEQINFALAIGSRTHTHSACWTDAISLVQFCFLAELMMPGTETFKRKPGSQRWFANHAAYKNPDMPHCRRNLSVLKLRMTLLFASQQAGSFALSPIAGVISQFGLFWPWHLGSDQESNVQQVTKMGCLEQGLRATTVISTLDIYHFLLYIYTSLSLLPSCHVHVFFAFACFT